MKSDLLIQKLQHTFLITIFAACAALSYLSCANAPTEHPMMLTADSLATSSPDSALALLNGIKKEVAGDDVTGPRWALIYNTAYYFKEKTLVDSLEDVTCAHFLNKKEGTETERKRAQLFHAIRLCRKDSMPEAMKLLICIEDSIDDLGDTYLKGVTEYFIASILQRQKLYENSKEAYRKEMRYAKEMGNVKHIANAECHLAVLFSKMGMKDSALYYSRKALKHKGMDNVHLATAYNNLAMLIGKYSPDSIDAIEYNLLQAYKHEHRASILANLIDFYYNKKGYQMTADSLLTVIQGSVITNESNTLWRLNKALYIYYDKAGLPDSAYKYYKAYMRYDSIEHNIDRQKDIVRIMERGANEERIKDMSRSIEFSWNMIAVITACIAILVFILIKNKKKFKAEIQKYQKRLNHETLENKKKTSDYKRELEDTTEQLNKKEEMNRTLLTNLFFSPSKHLGKGTSLFLEHVIDAFINMTPKNMSFMTRLTTLCPKLKLRERALCAFLYSNVKITDDVITWLGYGSNTVYRSAKYRMKKKLEEIKGYDDMIDKFIKEQL